MSWAVAAGHEATAEAAAEVLRAGGTAVDACIAGAFMAGVSEPILASLLGGGFLMVATEQGAPRCLDFFVETPGSKPAEGDLDIREILADFGTTTQGFHIGAGTVAVPGVIPGLFAAHEAYGRLPMSELAAQAVGTAKTGLVLTPFQARLLCIVEPIVQASSGTRVLFTDDGKPLEAGRRFANPALADVMETLVAEGVRFGTEGEIAGALASLPGTALRREDMAAYRPEWRVPRMVERNGFGVALNPGPSLGGVQIALALGALPRNPGVSDIASCFAAILDQRHLGDETLFDPETVEALAVLLRKRAAKRGTTHISAVDAQGNGAALTLSNGEGCGLVLPGTGLMPNNMLGEEDLLPDGPSSWRAGERLASMMCPTAIRGTEGGLTMLGSGGSNRIRTALTQVIVNLVDRGMTLEEAILAPRLHVDGAPARLDAEGTLGEADRDALRRDWPEAVFWEEQSMFFGGVHAVTTDARGVQAIGDPRRAGAVRIG